MVEQKFTGFLDCVVVGQVSKSGKAMPDYFSVDVNGMPIKVISWRALPACILENENKDVNVTVKADVTKTSHEGKEYTNYTLIEVLSVTPVGKPVCAADKAAMAEQDAKVAEVRKEVQSCKDANAKDAESLIETDMDYALALAIKLTNKHRASMPFTTEDVRNVANTIFIAKSRVSFRYQMS